MNIIADVAGRFNELLELIKIMPDDNILLLGDIVDRGPDSKKVIEWAMNNSKVKVLKGNHEDMMVSSWLIHNKELSPLMGYQSGTWENNGGMQTINSYGKDITAIPKEHIEWLKNLPVTYKEEGLFCSHAPWIRAMEFKEPTSIYMSLLWNRVQPTEVEGLYQIFGHNTIMDKYEDYAICLDDSGHKKLTGMSWPSKQIYQVDYEKETLQK